MARSWFRGEHLHRLDAKGRVSIPASFRQILEQDDPDAREGEGKPAPRLILVYGGTSHLECYTIAAMEKLAGEIDEIDSTAAKEAAVDFYITQSEDLEVDGNGRIVLPQPARDRLGPAEEVMFLGKLDTFRICTPAVYDAERGRSLAGIVPGDPATDPTAALEAVRRRRRQP